jgi:iron(III) transport system ATP-binding protein
MTPFFDIKNLEFKYGETPVFENLNLSLNKGERLGISGNSGCGKSTLLKIIAGLYSPTKGEISLNEKVLSNQNISLEPEFRQVGMIFQDLALFPTMSIEKNIAFGLDHLIKEEAQNRTNELLELIGLFELKDRKPSQISGGQAQRVALARSLAPSPSLLLLDEPFASLDRETAKVIIPQVAKLVDQTQTTCILVSHNPEDLELFCHRQAPFHSFS